MRFPRIKTVAAPAVDQTNTGDGGCGIVRGRGDLVHLARETGLFRIGGQTARQQDGARQHEGSDKIKALELMAVSGRYSKLKRQEFQQGVPCAFLFHSAFLFPRALPLDCALLERATEAGRAK